MCTALSMLQGSHFFGRNLDLEYQYNETVTVTPRNFPLFFRNGVTLTEHYAFIGMATVSDGYPLYYEATNEHGLSIAGLNFPGNAAYHPRRQDACNITPFELIPWILAQCRNVSDAKSLFACIHLTDEPFSKDFPLTPLHWLIADRQKSLSIEPLHTGLQISNNPVGVLTNNPPFAYHMINLVNYINLTSQTPENRFSERIDLRPFSAGMGAIGLPGDLSSPSRFVRAAFYKMNSVCESDEISGLTQFFHLLEATAQIQGGNRTEKGFEKTVYSSCCNTDRGVYYYKTYENNQISAVDMHRTDLNSSILKTFPLMKEQCIHFCN